MLLMQSRPEIITIMMGKYHIYCILCLRMEVKTILFLFPLVRMNHYFRYKLRVEFPRGGGPSSYRGGGGRSNNDRNSGGGRGGNNRPAARRSQYRVLVSGLPASGE